MLRDPIAKKSCQKPARDQTDGFFAETGHLSEGKEPGKNEDAFAVTERTIVVADGCTDKSGRIFWEKRETWGTVASRICVSTAVRSRLSGMALVGEITSAIRAEVATHGPVPNGSGHGPVSAAFVACSVSGGLLTVTSVWDCGFRIDGKFLFSETKTSDILTSSLRKNFLLVFWLEYVAEAREFIIPLLSAQHLLANAENPVFFDAASMARAFGKTGTRQIRKRFGDSGIDAVFRMVENEVAPLFGTELSYGTMDGTDVPERFVSVRSFPLESVHFIEAFTDGYFSVPSGTSVSDWESEFARSSASDPDRCLEYPSTKSSDDRTVVCAKILTKTE